MDLYYGIYSLIISQNSVEIFQLVLFIAVIILTIMETSREIYLWHDSNDLSHTIKVKVFDVLTID